MSESDDPQDAGIRDFLAAHGLQAPEDFALFRQAFIHRSYSFEHAGVADNERLEFLGDAVLGSVAAEFLCERYPDAHEGELSRMRAFLVSRRELGMRGAEIGLSDLVLLGRGEEIGGGRRRSSLLGSTLEAFVGALYFTLPAAALRDFIRACVLEPGVAGMSEEASQDFKSRLQETLQKRGLPLPEYRRVREEGPAHRRTFAVEVFVKSDLLGRGEGPRVKAAENRAAREACQALENPTAG
jgi:ribonuclease-3